ncbi:MAG TPA: type II toxin-antitoxin system VapC family toxin [Devosia sp.]
MIALDASVTAAWFFQDETTSEVDAIFRRINDEGAVVPPVWSFEVANIFRTALRRRRLDQVRRQRCFDILIAMPIEREFEVQDVWTKTVGLSDQHGLSVYDAAYLEVAMRRLLPLATLDKELRQAAIAEGVAVLP